MHDDHRIDQAQNSTGENPVARRKERDAPYGKRARPPNRGENSMDRVRYQLRKKSVNLCRILGQSLHVSQVGRDPFVIAVRVVKTKMRCHF